MTDREMLELAAKAAGLEYHWINVDGGSLMQASELGSRFEESWNPLADDGDALRLAVKLRITVELAEAKDLDVGCSIYDADTGCWTCVGGKAETLEAATRLAITRAAAEIGKQMGGSDV